MIVLDPHRKVKKATAFIAIFVAVAAILAFAFWKREKLFKPASVAVPEESQKPSEEKQKDMLKAINENNKDAQLPAPDKQDKSQQEMQEAIGQTNSEASSASQSQQDQKAQDMLKALNEANNR